MVKIGSFYFPDDLHYIFIGPISFYWVKKITDPENTNHPMILLGFTELLTKNLNKNEIRLNFRSENLGLRLKKPFVRLLTKNKYFEFLSPWKSSFQINPSLKSSFIAAPYENYILKCFDFEQSLDFTPLFQTIEDFSQDVLKMIEKETFKDCKECPDLFQSSITRRMDSNT